MKKKCPKDWRFDQIKSIKDENWKKKKFKKSDELFYFKKNYSQKYTNQRFNTKEAEIRKENWDHEHCEGCTQKISEDLSIGVTDAYVNDHDEWICEECYNDFFEVGRNKGK